MLYLPIVNARGESYRDPGGKIQLVDKSIQYVHLNGFTLM